MLIGKIVGSTSHVNYNGQVFTAQEIEVAPRPADFALGRFVRIKIRALSVTAPSGTHEERPSDEITSYAIGVIYNTMLLNFAATAGGPHLSSAEQVEIFSPDARAFRITLVSVLLLGMMKTRRMASGRLHAFSQSHGVPPFSLEIGSAIETMPEEEVQAFHLFADKGGKAAPYLHLGYLPHMQTQPHSLLPMIILQIIEQLERLFPAHLTLLAIIKRNFSWKLKIESVG